MRNLQFLDNISGFFLPLTLLDKKSLWFFRFCVCLLFTWFLIFFLVVSLCFCHRIAVIQTPLCWWIYTCRICLSLPKGICLHLYLCLSMEMQLKKQRILGLFHHLCHSCDSKRASASLSLLCLAGEYSKFSPRKIPLVIGSLLPNNQ